jgi:hypothetical protein
MAMRSRALEARGGLTLAAAAVYAWVAGGFDRFSWPATVGVFLPGTVALAAAARRRPAPPPGRLPPARHVDPRGAALWLGLFLAFCVWELAAFVHQPSSTVGSWDHPTLSVLADPVLASHPARSLALFGWLAMGWSLLRR